MRDVAPRPTGKAPAATTEKRKGTARRGSGGVERNGLVGKGTGIGKEGLEVKDRTEGVKVEDGTEGVKVEDGDGDGRKEGEGKESGRIVKGKGDDCGG